MSKGPVLDGLNLQRVAEPSERKRVDKRADFIGWLRTDDHLLHIYIFFGKRLLLNCHMRLEGKGRVLFLGY